MAVHDEKPRELPSLSPAEGSSSQSNDSDGEPGQPVGGDGDGDGEKKSAYSSERGPLPPSDNAPAAGARPPSRVSVAMSIIPRNKRRGLFGRFAMLPEIEHPYEYPNKTKWLITLIVALAGAAAPFAGNIFYRTFSWTGYFVCEQAC